MAVDQSVTTNARSHRPDDVGQCSVLFPPGDPWFDAEARQPADMLRDLNLDQVIEAVASGKDEYELLPFLHNPVPRTAGVRAIEYRHEVFRDLERDDVRGRVDSFGRRMRDMRNKLEQVRRLRYRRQKQRWFLDAVDDYCSAVAALAADLDGPELASEGLTSVASYLASYVSSPAFAGLAASVADVKAQLASVQYCLRIQGIRIDVTRYGGESDYSAEVAATFERFRRRDGKEYLVKFNEWPDMNHVEAQVLDGVATLYPDVRRGRRVLRPARRLPRRRGRGVRPGNPALPRVSAAHRADEGGGVGVLLPGGERVVEVGAGERDLRHRARAQAGRRRDAGGVQRLRIDRRGADVRRHRPEPGR